MDQTVILLIALYAILITIWLLFAHYIAPGIVFAAYADRSDSILVKLFQAEPGQYPNSWCLLSNAMGIAMVLHLAIVLFIRNIDCRQLRFRDSAKANANANAVLIVFTAVFLITTAATGFGKGDYGDYAIEWNAILNGRNPWVWNLDDLLNAYGPAFNVLALGALVNPLFNKLLFAFSYLVYVVWLIKEVGPRRKIDPSSWFCYGLLLFNLFPWVELAYLGHFDVLVGLASVAAVHSLVDRKDSLSGTYLASGILLKFMPIVVLPFLAFNGRRFHLCLVGCCLAFVGAGFLASSLVWGTSIFAPLAFAATRDPIWSIYYVMNSQRSPLRLIWDVPHAEWLEKPLLLATGLTVFVWCTIRKIELPLSATLAILLTLLLYRVGFPNYHLVFLCVVSYWSISEWRTISDKTALAAMLIGYFNFLAVAAFSYWVGISDYIFYSKMVIALVQFLLGTTVLIGLIWSSNRAREHIQKDALGHNLI